MTKTYRPRMVELPEMVAQDILEWRNEISREPQPGSSGSGTAAKLARADRDKPSAFGEAGEDPNKRALPSFMFPRRKDGKAWTVSDRQNWRRRFFSEACKSAGLDGFAPKDLRHTCASLLVCARYNRADLADHMGHSIQESEATYQHAIESYRGQPARSMDEMIAEARTAVEREASIGVSA